MNKKNSARQDNLEAFVKTHDATLRPLLQGETPHRYAEGTEEFVNKVARPELGYGEGTSWRQIWIMLRRYHNRIFAKT
jgi:hypothetical protein